MVTLHAKWGNPVGPGDTVYICGTHLSGRPSSIEGWLRPMVSGTASARIVVSGDCPDDSGGIDKGTIYGVHLQLNSSNWTDPDADGVYTQGYGGCTYPFLLEDGIRRLNWIPIDASNQPTIPYDQWPAGSFTQLGCGGAIYYKPSSGLPSDHSIHTAHSRLVVLESRQYINVQGLRLFAGSSTPVQLNNADFIRLENNEILWKGIDIRNDSDDGEIAGNKIHDMVGTAVYLITGGGDVNAQSNDRWRIAHNEIYNISPGNLAPGCEGNCTPYFDGGDRHGIGVQGGTNGAVVEYNHIHHIGGEGIIFYNWSNYTENGVRVGNNQRDNVIRYNYIHDIKDLWSGCLSGQSTCSNQRGIELGGDCPPPIPDTITGNLVHHNVLVRVNGAAFRFKSSKSDQGSTWRMLNNTVYASGRGLEFILYVPSSRCKVDDPPNPYITGLQFSNNILADSVSRHIDVANTADVPDISGIVMDNNLYHQDGSAKFRWRGQDSDFAGWKLASGLDQSFSTTQDPLFAAPSGGDFHWAGSPLIIPGAGDYRLTASSPVIDQGAHVGLTADIRGNPIVGSPDIGAYESVGPDLTHTLLTIKKSGNNVLITDTVKNQGNQSAGSFRISFYLSTDTEYQSGTDIFLCYRTVSSLAAGASNNRQNGNCQRPAGASFGVPYHVIAIDDSLGQIAEANETNNNRATTGTVQW
jgi:hypothetical protein